MCTNGNVMFLNQIPRPIALIILTTWHDGTKDKRRNEAHGRTDAKFTTQAALNLPISASPNYTLDFNCTVNIFTQKFNKSPIPAGQKRIMVSKFC